MDDACTACNKPYKKPGFCERTWWHLNKYFGFSGLFCPDCYDKVSHNSYKQPNNPAEYTMMLLKFSGVKNGNRV